MGWYYELNGMNDVMDNLDYIDIFSEIDVGMDDGIDEWMNEWWSGLWIVCRMKDKMCDERDKGINKRWIW